MKSPIDMKQKLERAWDNYLQQRMRMSFFFRGRGTVEAVEWFIQTEQLLTPNRWAANCRRMAGILRYLIGSSESDTSSRVKIVNCTPRRASRLMLECAKRAAAGVRAYVQRGINPQVQINILPLLRYAKQAQDEYQNWLSKRSETPR